MNIWILNHYAQTPEIQGGTRHYDFACELMKKGHNVKIFASSFHYSLLKDTKNYGNKLVIEENYNGIDFVWIKTPPYKMNNYKRFINIFVFAYRLWKFGKKQEKPDIIIGSTVHPLTPFVGYRLAKKFNVPFLFEIRDLWPKTLIETGAWKENSIVSKFFKYIEKKTVENSTGIISLSPMTEKYLKNEYGFNNNFYIPNGVNVESVEKLVEKCQLENIENSTFKIIEKLKSEGKFVVVYTGAIVHSNKIHVLVETADLINKKNNNISIVVIGDGQDKPRIENLIEQKKLKNIVLANPVKKSLLPYLLTKSHCLLLAQGKVLWGSSNKLSDYLAAKKPLISAVHAKHNDPVLISNCGISVEAENANSIANGILEMANLSDEKRKIMGENGYKYLKDNHDIKVLADRLISVISKTIKDFKNKEIK